MSPDPNASTPRRDDISVATPALNPAPLPPHYADLLDATAAAVGGAVDAMHNEIDAAVTQHADAIGAPVTDMHLAIRSKLGEIDSALEPHEMAASKVLDKVTTGVLSDVLHVEAQMQQAGVAVPFSTDDMRVDLADPTQERMAARLFGIDPAQAQIIQEQQQQGGAAQVPINDQLQPVALPALPAGVPAVAPSDSPSAGLVSPGKISTDTGLIPSARIESRQTYPPTPGPVPAPVPVPAPIPAPPTTCPTGPPPCCCPTSPPPPPYCTPPGFPEQEGVPACPITYAKVEVVGVNMPRTDEPKSPPPPGVPVYPGLIDYHEPPWSYVPWCYPDAPLAAQEVLTRYASAGGPDLISGLRDQSTVSQIYRVGATVFKTYADHVFGDINEWGHKAAIEANARLTGDILGGYSSVIQVFDALDPGFVPNKEIAWQLGLRIAQAAKAQESSGFPLAYITQPLTYLYQYANPVQIPTQGEANAAYLAGTADAIRWETWTRANGNMPDCARIVRDAGQVRPIVSDCISLYQRGDIETEPELGRRLRELGVLSADHLREYLSLAQFVPGPADLVRFMLRDSFDPAVVKQYQYDADFEAKFFGPGGRLNPGPAAKWARAQGMTDEQMRYYWYAHWQLPSNTALYEMMHRLREDRPEVIAWDRFAADVGEETALNANGPRPLVVTPDDVRRAIEINDMAPGWVQPLVAVSYHPINRTDAIDAYQAGTFSDDDLYHVMRDNGYSDPDAKRLVDIQRAKRNVRLANSSGIWTVRSVLKAYIDGAINGMRADALLTPLVLDPAQRQRLIDGADEQLRSAKKRARIKRVRRGYMVGQLSAADAAALLAAAGVPDQRIGDILDQAEEDRMGRYREPTVRLIIQWATLGIILPDDAYRRVLALGFTDIDARRIVYQGVAAQADAVQKKIDARTKEVKAIIKDQRTAARQTQKDLEQRQKDIEHEQDRLQKEADRIKKELKDRLPK